MNFRKQFNEAQHSLGYFQNISIIFERIIHIFMCVYWEDTVGGEG